MGDERRLPAGLGREAEGRSGFPPLPCRRGKVSGVWGPVRGGWWVPVDAESAPSSLRSWGGARPQAAPEKRAADAPGGRGTEGGGQTDRQAHLGRCTSYCSKD